VIAGFRCSGTESLFHDRRVARFANIAASALRKPAILNRAYSLGDLSVPPMVSVPFPEDGAGWCRV
jgi:hypothetical protein